MSAEPDIDIVGLSVDYRRGDGLVKHAVENFDLKVFPGQIVSIVGPSGCGKTSVLRAVLQAEIDEVEYRGHCRVNPAREGSLSYLQQKPALLPWRTALENVALGQEVRGLMSSDSLISVEELLNDFGLGGSTMSVYPDQLSVGMQQRVAIARALESSPKVLLCDEPFSSIDFISRLKLNSIFKRRCSSKVSVLMVTHNIDEAIFLSSHVCVMSGSPGRIVEVIPTAIPKFTGDAVAVRDRSEFKEHFDKIWNLMKTYENT